MSFVQSISAATSAAVSTLSTAAITTNSGDILIAALAAFSTTTAASVTDTYGNTWLPHPLSPILTAQTGVGVFAWYAKNISGGSGHMVTFSVSPANFISCVVHEFSGRALDFPAVDAQGAVDSTTTTAHNIGTVTVPQNGCDLFAFMSNNSASSSESVTPGTGWVVPGNSGNLNGTISRISLGMYQQNVARGQYSGLFATGDPIQATGLMFALKQPSYTFIQQSSVSSGPTVSTLTTPAAGTVTFTTGNTVVYVAKYSATSLQSVNITDTLNNTWQQVTSYYDPVGGVGISFGFAANIVGGTDNVVLTLGTSQTLVSLYVAEFSGLSSTPFTPGEFVINKVVAPGNGTNGIASSFTGSIARRPALLFGFCLDVTNSVGQVLSAGTTFNALAPSWAFGSGQFTSLPEHQRI